MLTWLLIMTSATAAAPDPRCASMLANDLLACSHDAWVKADADLNAQWMRMNRSEDLKRAQRAWIVWRDLECKAENYAIGGREEDIVRMFCLADLTQQRVEQLKSNFEWAQ